MRSRSTDCIRGLVVVGLGLLVHPVAAQTVVDLGSDTVHDRGGHRKAEVEVSVTTQGDTAIIIRRSGGFDSLRVTQESDVVRTGESIIIAADEIIGGDVVSIGGSVTVYGRVRGDVVAIGGEVRVKEGGNVEGDAVSIGGQVVREPGSRIGGQKVGMSFVPAGIFAPRGGVRGPIAILRGISLLVMAVFLLKMLFVLGIGWAARALARSSMDQFERTVSEGPWRALLVGLGAHMALAVLLVLLSITVIGLVVTIPAGIAMVPVNAMSLALIAALLGSRVNLARPAVGATPRPWTGSAAIGLALFAVPVILGLVLLGAGGVGTIAALVLLFFGGTVLTLAGATGFGAMVLTVFEGRRRAQPGPFGSAMPPQAPPPPTAPPPGPSEPALSTPDA